MKFEYEYLILACIRNCYFIGIDTFYTERIFSVSLNAFYSLTLYKLSSFYDVFYIYVYVMNEGIASSPSKNS